MPLFATEAKQRQCEAGIRGNKTRAGHAPVVPISAPPGKARDAASAAVGGVASLATSPALNSGEA
jgi:hypothetical protein